MTDVDFLIFFIIKRKFFNIKNWRDSIFFRIIQEFLYHKSVCTRSYSLQYLLFMYFTFLRSIQCHNTELRFSKRFPIRKLYLGRGHTAFLQKELLVEKSLSPISNSIYLLLNPPPLTPSLLTITCHILPHEFKSYQLSAVFIGLSTAYSMLGGKGGGLTLWSLMAEGRLFPSRIFLSRNFPDFPRLLHFHDFHQDLRIIS